MNPRRHIITITLVGFVGPSLVVPSSVCAERLKVLATEITAGKPEIDGQLDDPIWGEVSDHGNFFVHGRRTPHDQYEPKKAIEQTHFRLAADSDNLYIAVRAFDSRARHPDFYARIVPSQGRYEDTIDIFLAPGNDLARVLCVSIDVSGRVSMHGAAPGTVDSAPVVRTTVGRGGWRMEAALPLSLVGLTSLKTTKTLGFNLGRDRMTGGRPREKSYWMESRDVEERPTANSLIILGAPSVVPTALTLAQNSDRGSLDIVSEWRSSRWGPVTVSFWTSSQTSNQAEQRRFQAERGISTTIRAQLPLTESGERKLNISCCSTDRAECYAFAVSFQSWDWATIRSQIGALREKADALRRRAMESACLTPEQSSVVFYADWLLYQFEHNSFAPARLVKWLERANDLSRGEYSFRDAKGLQNRAIWSDLDQSIQPYTLWVPVAYRDDREWPVVIVLHGGVPASSKWGAPYWENDRSPYQAIRTVDGYHIKEWLNVDLREEFIILAPRARRNGTPPWFVWYEGPAQDDVFSALEDVKRTHRIDENRVHLTGLSAGGTGASLLAVAFPDRWASIVANGVRVRHIPVDWPAHRAFVTARSNPLDLAENLTFLPVFVQMSEQDRAHVVGRPLVARLQQLGGHTVFWEKLGGRHCETFAWADGEMLRWFTSHRRRENPSRFTFKTGSLRHAKYHWLTIEQFLEPATLAEVHVAVDSTNRVTIQASNVARISINLQDCLPAPHDPVKVVFNNTVVHNGFVPENGSLTISCPGAPVASKREKRARLEGPIAEAVLDPFVFTYGTLGSKAASDANRNAAERMAKQWQEGLFTLPRVKADVEITPDDIEHLNLVCFGGPDSNKIVQTIADALPVRFDDGVIKLGQREFSGDDLGIRLVFPNPLNPKRLIQINAGTAGALRRTGEIVGESDYIIYDKSTIQSGTAQLGDCVVCGWFDQQWRYDPKYCFEGRKRRPNVARDGIRRLLLEEVSTRKRAGTRWNATGNYVLSMDGAEVGFDRLRHADYIEISLDNNDIYEIQFLKDDQVVGNRLTKMCPEVRAGLCVHKVPVPRSVLGRGYNAVRVIPNKGDGKFSMGHLRLLDED